MAAEIKSIILEVKDLDKSSRTAIIAHAHYDNLDRTGDILRKGAFNKSWAENKLNVAFYFNHDDTQTPGSVVNLYEDSEKAYTQVKLGTHTLGEDILRMMDEGTLKSASFGYYTIKSNPIEEKGKKVRELKEVAHIETSILSKMPANPKAGLVNVVKSFEEARSEYLFAVNQLVLLNKSNASDPFIKEAITNAELYIKQLTSEFPGVDTASTPLITEPVASKAYEDGEALIRLKLLLARA